jgi:hypothetical protein
MVPTAGLAADFVAARATRGSWKEGFLARAGNRRSVSRLVLAATLSLQCAGCLVGPDFFLAFGPGRGQVARSKQCFGR